MGIHIFADVVQGSPEWVECRMGIPTASMFKEVTSKKGPRGGIPKGRQTYMYRLAGEIISGEPMDSYTNTNMERGQEREVEARDLYALLKDIEPIQIGFIKSGNCGASPDALVGDDGLIEIKDALAHIQIARLLNGELPPEHKAQCQGQLMVSQRQWVDFMSHSRGLPPLIIRVERDEPYIAAMKIDIDEFVDELIALTEQIRSM